MKYTINVKLGLKVKILRERKNLSQEQLGELSNLHRTYIGHIERAEKNATLITIAKLASALEVEPKELLNFDDII